MKIQKLLTLTTLPVLMAAITFAPASANPVNSTSKTGDSQIIAQTNPALPTVPRFARVTAVSGTTVSVVYRNEMTQDLEISPNLDMAKMEMVKPGAIVVAYKGQVINILIIGQISTISGSTVTVDFPDSAASDKTTKEYQVSPGDMTALRLSEGLYVGILNNQIVGVASVGRIVSMTGGIANVRMLLTGQMLKVGVDRAQIGAMGIQEGKVVYIVNNRIVAVAENLDETRLIMPSR